MGQEFIAKKKKWYRRKWFYIVLALVLLGAGGVYAQFNKSNQKSQYETAKVVRGALKQTVDATGNVESADELDLRFESAGRIAQIYKQINDKVMRGEVIAELNLSELNAAVAQASAAVTKAQADLDKQLAGNTPEYIAGLEASLSKARVDLEQAQGEVPGVENSKIVQKEYENMLVVLQAVQNILASSLTTADNILGVDNTLANDSFEKVLSVFDLSKLNTAKNKYFSAKSAKIDFDNLTNVVNKNSDREVLDATIDQGEEALLVMKEMLFAVAEVLDKTAPIGDLSQSSLDTLKTNIQTARANVTAKYGELIDQAHAIETARNTFYSYQASMEKAEANLNDAKNPPREVDVASYRATLQSAQASLAQAVANRNKSRIIAPAAGMIGKIVPKVGEFVTNQNDIVKLVSPHFEIKIDIPETDIIKIAIGNEAEVTLDAYGDDMKFKGKVAEIEKGETIIQDVVYYKVTVSLDDKNNKEILNGMTANVTFSTEQKNNVLFIPLRAVRSNSGKYARVLENGIVKEVQIKIGLRGDGGLVEIVDGLSEGQDVVMGTVAK